jgi:hypothetical protein
VYVWLFLGWLLVIVKIAFTPAVLRHWEVPVDPGWVILPTLALASVVTLLVLGHSWTADDR